MNDAAEFRRELLELSGVLGAACEDLAAALVKNVLPKARAFNEAEAINAAAKLQHLAMILRRIDEGGGIFKVI
jgi:hypothetical protein